MPRGPTTRRIPCPSATRCAPTAVAWSSSATPRTTRRATPFRRSWSDSRVPAEPGAVALVKLSSLGDVIHALPVAEALAASFPRARLAWLVERREAALLRDHPALDEVIDVDTRAWRSARTPGQLREALRGLAVLRRRRQQAVAGGPLPRAGGAALSRRRRAGAGALGPARARGRARHRRDARAATGAGAADRPRRAGRRRPARVGDGGRRYGAATPR